MICTCMKFQIFSQWQIFAVRLRVKKLELFQLWSYYILFESFFLQIDNLIRTNALKSMVKKLLVIVSLVFHDMKLYKKKREKEKKGN